MNFSIIIPSRYASSRLPGKPLIKIAGKPLIQHVYECAVASDAAQIIIATDDERIRNVAENFGADVCMTSSEHPSGTDRLAEVITKMAIPDEQIIVNLQGDEPLMPESLIQQVATNLVNNQAASVATLCERIEAVEDLFDTQNAKVVMDKNGYALYFSRACIPWDRDNFPVTTDKLPTRSEHYRHIGLYCYRASFIKEYVTWPSCSLEEMESLEQLRVLANGHKIHVGLALERPGPGVDTKSDVEFVERRLSQV